VSRASVKATKLLVVTEVVDFFDYFHDKHTKPSPLSRTACRKADVAAF
jgi:hypothetical protein